MYQKNALGADDISYLDLTTVLTLAYIRYDLRAMLMTKYPRHKLANDGTRFGVGQAIITPKVAKAELIARFRQWEQQGLVENVDAFKSGLIVERNGSDPNRLDIKITPDVINSLIVTGVQIGFLL
jgi:phage tail sheath gpL-like